MRVVVKDYKEDAKTRDGVWVRVLYSVGVSKNTSTLDFFVHNGETITSELIKSRTKKTLDTLGHKVIVDMH